MGVQMWGLKRSLRQNYRSSSPPKVNRSRHYWVLCLHQISCKSAARLWRNGDETFSHTLILVAVTSFTHCYLSALITPHCGWCYKAEICTILFLLRCPFIWYPFWPKSKIPDFGQKPWTIIRRFYRNRGDILWSFYSTVEGATKLNFSPFCSS